MGIYFEIFEISDSIAFTTKQARFQIFFTSFLNVFIISFLPYGCYVDNFSILTEGYQTSKDPLFNLRKIGIARGWIIFCLLIGFLLEKILDFIFEYFSSHYNQPVSDLIRACENGPCLNLIASKIMIYLTYPTTFILVSSTIFLTYGILGFQGIGFALLGLISNFIPSLCICTLGALSTNSLKLGKLTKVSQKPIDRVFNISWSSKNYCSHLFAIVYGVMIFGGFATVGALIGFLNNANLIKFQALQIFGSTIGFSLAYCINGIIMSGVQIISRISVHFFVVVVFYVFNE